MNDELSGQEVPPEDLPDQNLSGQEVPIEDLPDEALSGKEVPPEDMPDEDKGPLDTVVDSATKFAQPLNPHPGTPLSKEEVKSLATIDPNDPNTQMALSAGPGGIGPGMPLATFWGRGLKGAIESGLIQGKDEIDKANLGQGDPAPAVAARIAGSMVPGFIIGGVTGQRPSSSELSELADKKTSSLLSDMFVGASHSAYGDPTAPIPAEVKSKIAFKIGQGLGNATKSKFTGAALGALTGGLEGSIIFPAVESAIKHVFGDKLSAMSRKTLAPMLMRAAASETIRNPGQIIEHAKAITRGDNAMSKGVEMLFASGATKAGEKISDELSDDEKEQLKDHIESGGPIPQEQQSNNEPQQYAEGGNVEPVPINKNNEIANHWPDQNIALNTSRARVYNYLNSVRPQKNNPTAFPYDTEHKDPQKERDYDKAIHLAARPLSILNKVKDGSLTPKQMSAFNSMYPDLHVELSKRINKKIIEDKVNGGNKPNYKTRQAMSLFLGHEMDSTLSPIGIQTAQAVFSQQKYQAPTQNSTSNLNKIGKQSMTDDQHREQALNKN